MSNNPVWPMINQRICDVYGLNPNEVSEISIDFYPHQMPTVYVTLLTNEGTMQVVLDYLGNVVRDHVG